MRMELVPNLLLHEIPVYRGVGVEYVDVLGEALRCQNLWRRTQKMRFVTHLHHALETGTCVRGRRGGGAGEGLATPRTDMVVCMRATCIQTKMQPSEQLVIHRVCMRYSRTSITSRHSILQSSTSVRATAELSPLLSSLSPHLSKSWLKPMMSPSSLSPCPACHAKLYCL